MHHEEQWTEGDAIKLIGDAVADESGAVVDITGGTIYLQYWFDKKRPVQAQGSIDNGTAGEYSYTFTTGLPDRGLMYWQWFFKNSVGREYASVRVFEKRVRRRMIKTLA
jgi:hypothetical protein